MKHLNSMKWGLVTLCGCITCAVIGKYEHPMVAVLIASIVSMFGGLAVAQEGGES